MKQPKKMNVIMVNTPIHDWFEISYAHYLTIPRLVMESMPAEWQEKMVALLQEMDDTFVRRLLRLRGVLRLCNLRSNRFLRFHE